MSKNPDKPDNIILEGLLGSHAYGLATPESDEDIKGVWIESTANVLALGWQEADETRDHVDPDWSYHELAKFLRLAMACNPTILEMLYLSGYRICTEEGALLVARRDIFLSKRAAKSFGGYAMDQMRRLQNRNDGSFKSKLRKRYSKHARHCFRLIFQGAELLTTGHLTVDVGDRREELFAIGELPPEELVVKFEAEFAKFNAIESILPDEPNVDAINYLLLELRKPHK